MADLQEYFTTREMQDVMASFKLFQPLALCVTYGDIYRVEITPKGIETLKIWSKTLKEDRSAIYEMSSDRDWTTGELSALRALYQSKTNLIRHCMQRREFITTLLTAQETLADRVESYMRDDRENRCGLFAEVPF